MEGINKTGRGSASFGGGRQGSIGEAMQVDRYLINPTVALNKKKKKGCAQGVGLVKRRTGSFLSALTKKKKKKQASLSCWTGRNWKLSSIKKHGQTGIQAASGPSWEPFLVTRRHN